MVLDPYIYSAWSVYIWHRIHIFIRHRIHIYTAQDPYIYAAGSVYMVQEPYIYIWRSIRIYTVQDPYIRCRICIYMAQDPYIRRRERGANEPPGETFTAWYLQIVQCGYLHLICTKFTVYAVKLNCKPKCRFWQDYSDIERTCRNLSVHPHRAKAKATSLWKDYIDL